MKLPSGTIHWKRLADGGKAFLNTLGRCAWEIVKLWVNRVWDFGESMFERGKRAYEKQEPRIAAKCLLLRNWWEGRGLPIAILRLAGNALLFLPYDIGWYLLASVGHMVRLNPAYLLAWLVFAGSVRAVRFYFKEILPDQRIAHSVGKETNGTQIEGGC